MLITSITPHREIVSTDFPLQKLFVMLRLVPKEALSKTKSPTNFVFVIDTSGSMHEIVSGEPEPNGQFYEVDGKIYRGVTGGISKMDVVTKSLENLLNSGHLSSDDRIAIVQFDDQSSILAELTPGNQVDKLRKAICSLQNFSGGTRMGLGIKQALNILKENQMTSNRILIFTDGHTFDEEFCYEQVSELSRLNIPVTAIGVGDYNETLLTKLSDSAGGHFFHVDDKVPGALSINELPNKIIDEHLNAQSDVVTNLRLFVKTVRGVRVSRVIRVYPDRTFFHQEQDSYPLGNASGIDETVYIIELEVESRPPGKIRIAQVGLTYDLPGLGKRSELPPQNLIMQFTNGQVVVQPDPVVMNYVQQANILELLEKASKEDDPSKAESFLETANRIAEQIKDEETRKTINMAKDDLKKTRRISDITRKTVKMSARGKTVKMACNEDLQDFEEEAIRKALTNE